jgi:hypothetical protein
MQESTGTNDPSTLQGEAEAARQAHEAHDEAAFQLHAARAIAEAEKWTSQAAGRRDSASRFAEDMQTIALVMSLQDPQLGGELARHALGLVGLIDQRDPDDVDLLEARIRLRDLMAHFRDRQAKRAANDPDAVVSLLLEGFQGAGDRPISRILGVSERTLRSWRGRRPRRPRGMDRLALIATLLTELKLPSAGARVRWFERPRDRLEGRSPLGVIETGDLHEARTLLVALARGERAQLAA